MAYRIEIAEPALAEAEAYVLFIRNDKKEPEAAERWFRGLLKAVYPLEHLPERCPVIPEQREFLFEIRHLIYFSHPIIFHIKNDEKRVVIYRIYHGARRNLVEPDLYL